MQIKEKLSRSCHKFTFPIFVGSLVFVLTIVGLVVLVSEKPTTQQTITVSTSELVADLFPESSALTGEYPTFPEVLFDEYKLNTSIPVTPAAVNIYTFKANYTLSEALDFTKKFDFKNLNQEEVSETTTVFYDNQTKDSRGILVVDRQTGSFSFQSFGVHKPKQATGFTTPQSIAQAYLAEVGLWDSTLIFTTTYQKEEIPGLTFVEFHRDWDKVGLPILNIVGSLNAPENTRLADAQIASQVENPPDDSSIINVSNGEESKERPNDFNTITVGVDNNGRILFIDSNLRKLEKIDSTSNLDFVLKTPLEVLAELQQGEGIFSLTNPSGEGELDFAKVYPDNTAHGEKATINDFVLTYLEKANGVEQKFLQPMYVFRGTSTLDSGYHVQFAQAIPAIKMEESMSSTTNKKLEGFARKIISSASAYIGHTHFEIPGLGQVAMSGRGKFLYIPKTSEEEARSIDEIRTLFFNALSDQYTIDVSRKLIADENLLFFVEEKPLTEEYLYELFVKIGNCDVSQVPLVLTKCEFPGKGYFTNQIENVAKRSAQTLIEIFTEPTVTPTPIPTLTATPTPSPTVIPIPTVTPTPTPEIFEPLGVQTTLDRLELWAEKADIFPAGTISLALFRNPYGSTPPECFKTGSSSTQTACYITGTETSPSIYFYPEKTRRVIIGVNPATEITYADPGPLNESSQVWEVIALANGKLETNGLSRSRLYYEYEKVDFPESKKGWVVERKNLDSFLQNDLFPKLGLNSKEANDLLADARTSLINAKDSTYLKIGLTDENMLNKYLSLSISPAPNSIRRIHLMLTPINNPDKIPELSLLPITRNGFTLIETGVIIND